ncbi:MAG TPA: FkbM family methyltransferase [Acetobacteraceae bacterium]|nr:FkbM family methyltransferase [Acetobacteraceae bacterium]
MDLARIRDRGRSTSGRGWATNPMRGALWRLSLPYYEALAAEFHAELAALRQMREQAEADRAVTLDERLAALRDELAGQTASRPADAAELRTKLAELHGELRGELASMIASRQAGATKDAMAIAHRLGGLEEEAAAAAQARTRLEESIATVRAEAQHAVAYVEAVHRDSVAAVEGLRAALGERIDAIARGAPLRAGDRIALGRGNLVLVATPEGPRFIVRQHDLIGRLVADGQEWEPHVRAAIERAARPDGIAVDAGAYIGLHTVTMARCFAHVHAFEPQRGIYQLLCGNLVLNGCANVEAHQLALYDHAGGMRLAPPERQEIPTPMADGQPDYARISNAAALTFESLDGGAGEVRAVTLDELGLEGVALIKIDTQGADLRVLRGAEATIRRCRPVVLFEWERDLAAQHGSALEEFPAFFAPFDYEVAVLHETTPGRQADYVATPR